MNTENLYKIVYTNQSIKSASTYRLIKESKLYNWFENVCGSSFIYRISKKTYKTKAFKGGEYPYSFDVPTPTNVIKL
jgi:hypothetical protein